MKPFYRKDDIVLYHADCRELLPQLPPVDAIITDPVWPNAVKTLAGSENPAELFAQAAQSFPRLAKRVVVELGFDSDPRFLQGMPPEMPYLRTCWLGYAFPFCKGRALHSGDVAYAFGEWPPARPGRMVIPGFFISAKADLKMPAEGHSMKKMMRKQERLHPCPRRLEHVRWLLKWWADGPVLDPFAGVGTTLLAAKLAGFPAVGIEVEEAYCERAARRLDAVPRHLFAEQAKEAL